MNIDEKFTVAQSIGPFHKGNDEGLCSKLSLPLHQKQSNQEARERQGVPRLLRNPAGAASAGAVCAHQLSYNQNRVLPC